MKKLQSIYLLLVIVIVGCQGNQNPCNLADSVIKDINKEDSLIKVPEIIERDRNWKKHNYKEPSLFDAKIETYRFIWSSCFDGTEVYRIEKRDKEYKAIVKVFAYHDTIGTANEFNISKEVWDNITDSLKTCSFWTYTTTIDRNGLDGAVWILEGFKPIKDECTLKKYHHVGRWSPDDEQFIAMCNLFFKLKQK